MMNLSDTTSLKELFELADSWAAMPVSALSSQQIALISLKNSYTNIAVADKNGGARPNILSACFICLSGA